jgi:hypothetical protein
VLTLVAPPIDMSIGDVLLRENVPSPTWPSSFQPQQ